MRKILKFILRLLARRTLQRYRPIVIGITGSVGKTTAKEAIYAVLNKKFLVWKNAENFNNEIGVPLAVLGITPGRGKLSLTRQLLRALWHAYGRRRAWYPHYLVLELAADRPGDIGYLVDMVRPQIAVITAIGHTPVHVEFYPSPQAVAKEKAAIMRYAHFVALNADDPVVADMRAIPRAPVMTFGLHTQATVWASDVAFFLDREHIGGLSFKVHLGQTFVPMRLPGMIAAHQIYAVLGTCAVAMHLGMNLVEIADALERMELPKGRMVLIRGIRDTMIIDDTYNASPLSVSAALDTLKQFPGRRIAILGDMAELGLYARQEHETIGALVPQCANLLVTVGQESRATAQSAVEAGMPADAVTSFTTTAEALAPVRGLIQGGDVILVKGSRVMRMEQIVDALKEKS